jgi:hypothetical protein
MARTWLSIRVDLVEGHGVHLWPRPGRIFAAARSHTFSDLAGAIDDAFARWDRSHLQEFTLADGTRLCDPDPDWQVEGQVEEDYRRVRLSRLRPGEQFAYVFDLGDNWAHLCTVGDDKIDPVEALESGRSSHCPIGAGETSPTSTGAAGTATMENRPCHLTPRWLTSRHRGGRGDLTAQVRDRGRPRCEAADEMCFWRALNCAALMSASVTSRRTR